MISSTIRGLARAADVLLPTCDVKNFVANSRKRRWTRPRATSSLRSSRCCARSSPSSRASNKPSRGFAQRDPILNLCATVPGVGLIVAATFVSVIDEAKRFKNAHAVGAYLGLVPSELTTGGPNKRRLGSITKLLNVLPRLPRRSPVTPGFRFEVECLCRAACAAASR